MNNGVKGEKSTLLSTLARQKQMSRTGARIIINRVRYVNIVTQCLMVVVSREASWQECDYIQVW